MIFESFLLCFLGGQTTPACCSTTKEVACQTDTIGNQEKILQGFFYALYM